MIIKILIFLIFFIMSCKTTQKETQKEINAINNTQKQENKNESKKEDLIPSMETEKEEKKDNAIENPNQENQIQNTSITPEKKEEKQENKQNVAITDSNTTNLNTTTDSSIDNTNTTNNLIKEEEKKLITFYKKQFNTEEDEYFKDNMKFYEDKSNILFYKKNSELENQSYEDYRISYKKSLEEKKQQKIEILNQIDPERQAFWRRDSNLLFNELIYIQVSESVQYKLCSTENPYEFIYIQEFKKNMCQNQKNIDVNLLKNRNYFEEISIFELLPKKKGFYILIEEKNNLLSPLKIRDKNNDNHVISFMESDGNDLLKLYIYNIVKKQNQNRIYFKIISPIDILFRLPE